MSQLSLLLWSWIETTRGFLRARLWWPFAVLLLVQWGVILLLTQFYRSPIATVSVPLLRAMGGDGMLHYPIFYVLLPTIFSWVGYLVDLLVGAWCLGAAYVYFWQADHPAEASGGAFGRANGAYGRLVLARLPVAVLLVLIGLADAHSPAASGNALRLVRYGPIVLAAVFESVFIYAPLVILVEGRGVMAALARSARIAARIPVATFLAVLVPNFSQFVIQWFFTRAEGVVLNMSPEVVAWALAAAVAVYSVAMFYVIGSAARLFRVRTEGAEA